MANELVIQGRLSSKLPIETGEGRNGPWQRQNFIVELPGNYPTNICVELWGERVNLIEPFKEGDQIQVNIDLSSREFNGKWYTNVRAWRVSPLGDAPSQAGPQDSASTGASSASPTPSPSPAPSVLDDALQDEDDLPF